MELDVSAEGRPDVAGSQGQAEEEKENSPSTEQQTQESEVCLILGLSVTNMIVSYNKAN